MKETGKTKPEKENVTSNFGFPSLLSLFCFVSVEWNDTTDRIPLPSYETRYPKFSMAVLRYVEHHQCPSTFGIGPTTLFVCALIPVGIAAVVVWPFIHSNLLL